MRIRQRSLLAVGISAFFATAGPAEAHIFAEDGNVFTNFLAGNEAVFLDLQVSTSLLAAALLFGIWRTDGLIKVWPVFLAGNAVGIALSAAGVSDPFIVHLSLTMLLGLGAAAEISLPVIWMRGLALLIGTIPVIAILFDHNFKDVPIPFIAGILVGLNLLFALAIGIVLLILWQLPYGWVRIAWRALAAWLVAITLMILALEISTPPFEEDAPPSPPTSEES